MRHRKRGRRLGRSSSHRKAMYRNMASSLFLTFRDEDFAEAYGYERKQPAGRIITTLEKAKEVRSLVEKCITIARKAVPHREASEAIIPRSELSGDNRFRKKNDPERWAQWSEARAPYVTAQRRCFQLLGSREAVALLFDVVVDELGGRTHGYTRIVRLATPRLGDAGTRAILEIVQNDKVRESYSSTEAPALEVEDEEVTDESAEVADDAADDESGDEVASEDTADESADDSDNEEAAAEEDSDSEADESEDDDSEADEAEAAEESADDEPAAEADSEEEASSDDSEEASSEADAEASDEDESSDEESDD